MEHSIWQSRVNSFLGILFVGSFALGTGLIIWHAAFGVNPLAQMLAAHYAQEVELGN